MTLGVEKRTLIIVIIFGISTVFIIGAIIFPTVQAIREAEKQTRAVRLFFEERFEKATHLRISAKRIKEISDATDHYAEHLVQHGGELKAATALELIAAKVGVTQKIVSSNVDSLTANDHLLRLSLSLKGTYEQTMAYINEVEHSLYFFSVQNLSISPNTENANNLTDSHMVNMTLDLNLYVN